VRRVVTAALSVRTLAPCIRWSPEHRAPSLAYCCLVAERSARDGAPATPPLRQRATDAAKGLPPPPTPHCTSSQPWGRRPPLATSHSMAFQRPTNARPPANDVETVDLTLSSSPEPDRQPKQPQSQSQSQRQHNRYPDQPRLPSHLKKEHGKTPIRSNGASSSSSRSQIAAAAAAPHPLPSVSADHIRQIINSSPPQKIAQLLLDLCKSSPALSGAVARGLAPHSSWAQHTINDYQRRTGLPRVKSGLGKPSSSAATLLKPSPDNRSYGSPRTPHPKVPVKSELDTLEPESDDSLSDLDTLLEEHSRSNTAKSVAGPSSINRTATYYTPTSSHASRSGGRSALSVRVKPEPKDTAQSCMQCNKTIQPGTSCLFHVGRTKLGPNKIALWTCCSRPVDTAGCCAGEHMPLRESTRDPTPTSTGPKKPRLI
jgi:hypothetical protein